MAYWTPWYQPADVTLDLPLTDAADDNAKAFGSSVCVPAPDSSVFTEQALVAMRGDRAITSAAGPVLTGSDVVAATISGAKHTDDLGNFGPNYIVDGLSAFPAMGVGFASEYSIPHGPFDPAWDSASAARSGANYFDLATSSVYNFAATAADNDPALAAWFASADDWEYENRLYADTSYIASSYLVTGSTQLLYHVEPTTDHPWDLDFYFYDPNDYLGHYAFWHTHGDVVATVSITDNTVVDGVGVFPESSFPSGFVTVAGGVFGTGPANLYAALEPYLRRVQFVHRAAASLSAYYATGEDEVTNQHAQISGLVARVTMRPARVRFYIDYPIPPNLAGAASGDRRRFEVPGGVV